MPKNTMPEMYEEQTEGVEQPTQEQILMSESELLRGLIEAFDILVSISRLGWPRFLGANLVAWS